MGGTTCPSVLFHFLAVARTRGTTQSHAPCFISFPPFLLAAFYCFIYIRVWSARTAWGHCRALSSAPIAPHTYRARTHYPWDPRKFVRLSGCLCACLAVCPPRLVFRWRLACPASFGVLQCPLFYIFCCHSRILVCVACAFIFPIPTHCVYGGVWALHGASSYEARRLAYLITRQRDPIMRGPDPVVGDPGVPLSPRSLVA